MTLTIQDLGALGELLGSVAVLVTLIYLAFQTRQNRMAIDAQLDAARINAVLSINLTAATSSELQEALNEDRARPRTINEARRTNYWAATVYQAQWNFIQDRRGLTLDFRGAGLRILGLFRAYRSFRRLVGSQEGWIPPRVRLMGRGATLEGGLIGHSNVRHGSCCGETQIKDGAEARCGCRAFGDSLSAPRRV